MTDDPPNPAQLAAAHLAVWLALPESRRTRLIGGILDAAVYLLRNVETPPLCGRGAGDSELLDRAEADIAAALALGWTDDGTVARLARARDLVTARVHPHTAAKR